MFSSLFWCADLASWNKSSTSQNINLLTFPLLWYNAVSSLHDRFWDDSTRPDWNSNSLALLCELPINLSGPPVGFKIRTSQVIHIAKIWFITLKTAPWHYIAVQLDFSATNLQVYCTCLTGQWVRHHGAAKEPRWQCRFPGNLGIFLHTCDAKT